MADMFSPKLTPIGAPSVIDPGVQDNSMASLLKSFGGMAVDAYKGYQVAELERTQEEDMESFYEYGLSSEAVPEVRKLSLQNQEQAIALDQVWESGNATWENVDVMEKGLQQTQQRLLNAMEQGKLSPDQFRLRVMSNLREAINRNPGLQQELVAQTEKLMKLSGMEGYLSGQDAMMKAQQKRMEAQQQMDEHVVKQTGIDFMFSQPERRSEAYQEWENSEASERRRKFVDTQVANDTLNKLETANFILNPTLWRNQTTGDYSSFDNEYRTWVSSNPEATPAQRKLAIEEMLQRRVATYSAIGSRVPQTKGAIDAHTKALADRAELYAAIADGGEAAKHAQNLLTAKKALEALPNVELDSRIDRVGKLAQVFSFAPNASSDALSKHIASETANIVKFLQTGKPDNNPLSAVNPSSSQGKATIEYVAALTANPDSNAASVDQFLMLEKAAIVSDPNPVRRSQVTSQTVETWLKSASANKTTLGALVPPETKDKMEAYLVPKINQFAAQGYEIDIDKGNNRFVLRKGGVIAGPPTKDFNNMMMALQSLAGYDKLDLEAGMAIGEALTKNTSTTGATPSSFPRADMTPKMQSMQDTALLQEAQRYEGMSIPQLKAELAAINRDIKSGGEAGMLSLEKRKVELLLEQATGQDIPSSMGVYGGAQASGVPTSATTTPLPEQGQLVEAILQELDPRFVLGSKPDVGGKGAIQSLPAGQTVFTKPAPLNQTPTYPETRALYDFISKNKYNTRNAKKVMEMAKGLKKRAKQDLKEYERDVMLLNSILQKWEAGE